jgi:hypothetical protein
MLLSIKNQKATIVLFLFSSICITDCEDNDAVSVMEYFYDSEKQVNEDDSSEDAIYKCYEAVLDSKTKDETLVSLCIFLSK